MTLLVTGADLMSGTPIYDIKPYLPLSDCRPEATGGFTDEKEKRRVRVTIPEEAEKRFTQAELKALSALLAEDPRPAYQENPERIYAFEFAGKKVRFRVKEDRLTVLGDKE